MHLVPPTHAWLLPVLSGGGVQCLWWHSKSGAMKSIGRATTVLMEARTERAKSWLLCMLQGLLAQKWRASSYNRRPSPGLNLASWYHEIRSLSGVSITKRFLLLVTLLMSPTVIPYWLKITSGCDALVENWILIIELWRTGQKPFVQDRSCSCLVRAKMELCV